MARGNEQVQQRLFDRMDMLLNIQGAEAEMAEALTEVGLESIQIFVILGNSGPGLLGNSEQMTHCAMQVISWE